MNESQIRNMTPDELLNAFECGQLTDDNVKQAFGQMVEAYKEEKQRASMFYGSLENIDAGSLEPYAEAFRALDYYGLAKGNKPHKDDRQSMCDTLLLISGAIEELNL